MAVTHLHALVPDAVWTRDGRRPPISYLDPNTVTNSECLTRGVHLTPLCHFLCHFFCRRWQISTLLAVIPVDSVTELKVPFDVRLDWKPRQDADRGLLAPI